MKKLFALVLVAALSFSMVSCTQKSGASTEEGKVTEKSSAEKDSQKTSESNPLRFKVTTVNFGETPTDKLIQEEWLKLCEEKMGRPLDINFEYINIADYGEKLKIIMAGGDLAAKKYPQISNRLSPTI